MLDHVAPLETVLGQLRSTIQVGRARQIDTGGNVLAITLARLPKHDQASAGDTTGHWEDDRRHPHPHRGALEVTPEQATGPAAATEDSSEARAGVHLALFGDSGARRLRQNKDPHLRAAPHRYPHTRH